METDGGQGPGGNLQYIRVQDKESMGWEHGEMDIDNCEDVQISFPVPRFKGLRPRSTIVAVAMASKPGGCAWRAIRAVLLLCRPLAVLPYLHRTSRRRTRHLRFVA